MKLRPLPLALPLLILATTALLAPRLVQAVQAAQAGTADAAKPRLMIIVLEAPTREAPSRSVGHSALCAASACA